MSSLLLLDIPGMPIKSELSGDLDTFSVDLSPDTLICGVTDDAWLLAMDTRHKRTDIRYIIHSHLVYLIGSGLYHPPCSQDWH